MPTLETLGFVVNGKPVTVEVAPDRTLLAVIRDDLGLKGTKEGCSQGHCGACSVMIDGEVVRSCHVAARDVAGRRVTTVEGLGTRKAPHPVQRAFVEAGAVQCGFCTPGALISAVALLKRNSDPSREEVLAAFNRNLCRCTGYVKMIEAVRLAASFLRGEDAAGARTDQGAVGRIDPGAAAAAGSVAVPAPSYGEPVPAPRDDGRHAIGLSLPRRDAWDKVLGEARFAADLELQGMCHLKVVRSPHVHARIRELRIEAASAAPGVVAVLTAKDIPGRNAVAIFRADQPILAIDRVRHLGEPVALVVAETVEAAEVARDLVEVDWEPLPVLATAQEALAEGAPRVHDDVPNEVFVRRLVLGDAEAALATAHVVVEGSFSTPYNEHAYMEPEAGLAYVDGERVVVLVGTQNAQHSRKEVAKVLGVDPEDVRIVQTTTGGGFGGKLDVPFPGLLAVAAYLTGKPVRLVLTREESFVDTTKRHPFSMDLRLGAAADGDLVALTAELVANTGAYLSFGAGVVTRAVVHATGPYRIPNVRVRGSAVHTTGPVSGAMRGFGVPQVTFALESLIDELAARLDMDPLEFRRRNGYRDADTTASGQQLEARVPYLRTLEALGPAHSRARDDAARQNAVAEGTGSRRRRGVGLASMWFGPGKTSLSEKSEAFLELLPTGDVRVVTTAADIGQGLETVLAQIAAEELAMSYHRVHIRTRDTDGAPDGGFTCASRQTYNTGNAVLGAARLLKQSVMEAGAEMLAQDPAALRVADGAVHVAGDPERRVTFADLVAAGHTRRFVGMYTAEVGDLDENGQGRPYETYTFGSQLAEVEVDLDTGRVDVARVTVAHDVGTVINPQSVEGQLEGGVLMGIGYALKEEFVPGITVNFRNYRIPRSKEAPEIEVLLFETPHEHGPFGAAGAGECSQMPTAPAIANAIFDAVGLRMRDLPITPDRLRQALQPRVAAPVGGTTAGWAPG